MALFSEALFGAIFKITFRYLVGEVMYGGRAIDSFDRRILTTYMEEYFGDFIFDTFQPYHFYANKEVDYCIPEDNGGKEAYTTMIETLPLGSVKMFAKNVRWKIFYRKCSLDFNSNHEKQILPKSLVFIQMLKSVTIRKPHVTFG